LLGRQFWKFAERIDLGLERQLPDVHKPVAVVVLSMDAKRRTNAVAEPAWRKRILLRKDLNSRFRESRPLDGHAQPKCKVVDEKAALSGWQWLVAEDPQSPPRREYSCTAKTLSNSSSFRSFAKSLFACSVS
jgi:hypothetical protein